MAHLKRLHKKALNNGQKSILFTQNLPPTIPIESKGRFTAVKSLDVVLSIKRTSDTTIYGYIPCH